MSLSLINKAASPTEAVADAAPSRVNGADVLVAIPVLNEAAHIETCIRSLMDGDERVSRALFVVVDGGSRDQTQKIVFRLMGEFQNLRLLDNPRRLQSAAVNLAAREMGEGRRVLVRCDAHATYPKNYVMDVADSLVSHGVASVATPGLGSGPKAARKRSRNASIGQAAAEGRGTSPSLQRQPSRRASAEGVPITWTGTSRSVGSPETNGAGWWSPSATISGASAAWRSAKLATTSSV